MAAVLNPSRADRSRQVHQAFEAFRAELDSFQDRRELLVKASRDITAQSKKVIFALHRITVRPPEAVFREADGKIKDILKILESLEGHLRGNDAYRLHRAISPGIEEFIEAISFLHFLRTRSLISLHEVQSVLSNPSPPHAPYVLVTLADFLLGLSDLTGELMRYAINSIGTGHPAVASEVATFLRNLKAELDPLVPSVPLLSKKMPTMQSSLRKLEEVAYTLAVRTAESGPTDNVLMWVQALTQSVDAADRERDGKGDDDFD